MIEKTDKIMLIDCETTNSLEDPLVYDLGFQIFDLMGNTYETQSLVNSDVFFAKDLMESAFYADKMPMYLDDLRDGKRTMMKWARIKSLIRKVCKAHGVKYVVAHNARFDNRAVNLTQRYLTSSKWRYFLPYGVEWLDTLKMCREVLTEDEDYLLFCADNDYLTANGKPRFTAEIVYRFISGNNEFEEKHTGFEDTQIERKIFEYCVEQNPNVDGKLWKVKPQSYLQWLAFHFYEMKRG